LLYNEELIIRYESLIGKFNNSFLKPIEINNESITLYFLNSSFCMEFVKYFLQDYHMCKLLNNSKTVKIKILNLYNIENLLKSILLSLEKSISHKLITVNRNCFYG